MPRLFFVDGEAMATEIDDAGGLENNMVRELRN
jgi:hypothetical protein